MIHRQSLDLIPEISGAFQASPPLTNSQKTYMVSSSQGESRVIQFGRLDFPHAFKRVSQRRNLRTKRDETLSAFKLGATDSRAECILLRCHTPDIDLRPNDGGTVAGLLQQ